MQIFVTLDDTRHITGCYPEDVFSEDDRPEDCIEISEAVWQAWLYDQTQILGEDLTMQAAPVDLALIKDGLKSRVDAIAETTRLKFITAGAGQAMTYQQKNDEATRFLTATNPDANDYPLLSAEIGITGDDVAAVAAVIRNAYTQWQVIGAGIERNRLGAKKAIDDAESADAAQAAFAAVSWPSSGA